MRCGKILLKLKFSAGFFLFVLNIDKSAEDMDSDYVFILKYRMCVSCTAHISLRLVRDAAMRRRGECEY